MGQASHKMIHCIQRFTGINYDLAWQRQGQQMTKHLCRHESYWQTALAPLVTAISVIKVI
jgi:hypothetical protein